MEICPSLRTSLSVGPSSSRAFVSELYCFLLACFRSSRTYCPSVWSHDDAGRSMMWTTRVQRPRPPTIAFHASTGLYGLMKTSGQLQHAGRCADMPWKGIKLSATMCRRCWERSTIGLQPTSRIIDSTAVFTINNFLTYICKSGSPSKTWPSLVTIGQAIYEIRRRKKDEERQKHTLA